mmetsp:Transcript_53336/g.87192  ORF Transcript_53336/g.87192 Transcript_53336/m.87192 type:complete len:292 (-) Transcript_53336:319-1194(-)
MLHEATVYPSSARAALIASLLKPQSSAVHTSATPSSKCTLPPGPVLLSGQREEQGQPNQRPQWAQLVETCATDVCHVQCCQAIQHELHEAAAAPRQTGHHGCEMAAGHRKYGRRLAGGGISSSSRLAIIIGTRGRANRRTGGLSGVDSGCELGPKTCARQGVGQEGRELLSLCYRALAGQYHCSLCILQRHVGIQDGFMLPQGTGDLVNACSTAHLVLDGKCQVGVIIGICHRSSSQSGSQIHHLRHKCQETRESGAKACTAPLPRLLINHRPNERLQDNGQCQEGWPPWT